MEIIKPTDEGNRGGGVGGGGGVENNTFLSS